MNFVALVSARSVCTTASGVLASTGVTMTRLGVIKSLYAASSVTLYLHEAGRAYVLMALLSVPINTLFFAMLGPKLPVMVLKRFAFGATATSWLLAGIITATYVNLPFSLPFWWVSTIGCAIAAGIGAAELCPKFADLFDLL